MKRRRFILAAWALLSSVGAGALAQGVVASDRPDRVAVTVYRDPSREPGDAPNLEFLGGYALVSETRQITIPAGESTIRFEGVAGGLVPQSAIVTGFPEGIIERNRDAYLLSPGTLLDRSLGRRVHIRRTSYATGAVREQEAVIRSGANGAVVLQTADGYEALRCTGLPDGLVYDEVPDGLSARPTLSVRTRSSQPVTATVTLSYIATGFDWQANYIVMLDPDGRHVDLFAWMTLASNDETSFPEADTQAVAGNINYNRTAPQPREGGPISLRCWPAGRTSDIPYSDLPPPPPARMIEGYSGDDQSIVVTGTRLRSSNLESASPVTVLNAQQEDLGDLKLYRIPEPVTVAANSQKQVALMTRPNVRAELVYRSVLDPADDREAEGVPMFLISRNRTEEGLGLPLPAGRLVLFGGGAGRPIVMGESFLSDRAIGEDVEVEFGVAVGVTRRIELIRQTDDWSEYRLTVTSDRPAPVRFEAQFSDAGDKFRPRRRLGRRDGMPLWVVRVPANGRASLRYRIMN